MVKMITSEADVVLKSGAKGAAALVFDDGIQDTATYIANAMKKYTDIEISFAVRTDAFGSFVKNGDDYAIDENGKYTFTQSSGQKRNTAFWIDESTVDSIKFNVKKKKPP